MTHRTRKISPQLIKVTNGTKLYGLIYFSSIGHQPNLDQDVYVVTIRDTKTHEVIVRFGKFESKKSAVDKILERIDPNLPVSNIQETLDSLNSMTSMENYFD